MALCCRKVDKADRRDRERTLLNNVTSPVMLARHINLGNNTQSMNSAGKEKKKPKRKLYNTLSCLV